MQAVLVICILRVRDIGNLFFYLEKFTLKSYDIVCANFRICFPSTPGWREVDSTGERLQIVVTISIVAQLIHNYHSWEGVRQMLLAPVLGDWVIGGVPWLHVHVCWVIMIKLEFTVLNETGGRRTSLRPAKILFELKLFCPNENLNKFCLRFSSGDLELPIKLVLTLTIATRRTSKLSTINTKS